MLRLRSTARMRIPAAILVAAAGLVGASLAAADPVLPPAPLPVVAEGQGERLARLLGVPGLVQDSAGALRWGGAAGLAVIDVSGQGPDAVVDTVAGRLVVPRRLLARPALGATLAACARQAQAAGLAAEDLQVAEGFLLGLGLRRADAIVLPTTVLRPAPATAPVMARWLGPDAELVQIERPDGMLHRLRLPGRRAFALPVRGGDGLQIVVDLLPSGTAPASARLLQAGAVIATWDGTRLEHDDTRWRTLFAGRPPHLAIPGEDGRLEQLVTRYGTWSASNDPDGALAALATALPDAAHVALFAGVALIPAADRGREPSRILAESQSGRMPVGPEEAAELLQAITRRQGRSPLILASRQAHCVWSELAGDGRWHVHAIGLGSALDADALSAPVAVSELLRQLDSSAIPDPDAFPIRVRLDSGVTDAVAGWAALADPERARLAREAARLRSRAAWHRLATQLRPAAAATDGAPERRLLAAALSARGDQRAAADLLADDAEDSADPLRRLAAGTAQVELLARIDPTAAAVVARRILADPEHPGHADASARCAGALAGAGVPALAVDLFAAVLDPFENALARQTPGPALARWATAGTACLAAAGPDALPGDPRLQRLAALIQRWLEDAAFRTLPPPLAYRAAADYYAAVLGETRLRTLIAAAEPPAVFDLDHRRRTGSLAQLHLDLPWISVSGPWWNARLDQTGDVTTAQAAAAALGRPLPPGFAGSGDAAAARVQAAALARQSDALRTALIALAATTDSQAIWAAAVRLGRSAGSVDQLTRSQWPRMWADAGLDRGALAAMAWAAVASAGPGVELARVSLPLLRDVGLARDAALAADECQAIIER